MFFGGIWVCIRLITTGGWLPLGLFIAGVGMFGLAMATDPSIKGEKNETK